MDSALSMRPSSNWGEPLVFSENRVDDDSDLLLPPHPPNICHACWIGLFAKHLGLPCVSPPDSHLDLRWPQDISYSISLAGIQPRADAGCIWCQLLLPSVRYQDKRNPGSRSNVTVMGFVDSYGRFRHSGPHYQGLKVEVNGRTILNGFVYTTADDPAASSIVTRNPVPDVGSTRALAFAREHIDQCVHGHVDCRRSISPVARLPTRLVDCADLSRPRLVPTRIEEHGEYLALSYVWGEEQLHKTTKSNISTYERRIPPALLPQTILDAIRTTHMLGFRWLWVDSLCIVQDSEEDKLHEISRMHHIYRYAHLTIIAASARTVSEGFLHKRSTVYDGIALPFICFPIHPNSQAVPAPNGHSRAQLQAVVGQVYIASRLSMPLYTDGFECMSSRAWCMQEYLMSPRSLIFTSTTFRFRCLTTEQSVGSTFCPQIRELRIPNTLFLPVPPAVAPGSRVWKDIHTAWIEVVENYSRRTASVESDKLVACAAVAEQFHRVLRSDYLAGMWRSEMLLTDLLWDVQQRNPAYGPRHTRPTMYRAPSWSWAAIDGTLHRSGYASHFKDPRTVALAEIVECGITLEDDELPFGRVTGGTLILRGTLIPCHCGVRDSGEAYSFSLPSLKQIRRRQLGLEDLLNDDEDEIDSLEPELQHASVHVDCQDDETSGNMWVVPFVWMPGQNGDVDAVSGLGVTEVAPSANSGGSKCENIRFRRVGTFCTSADARKRKDLAHPLWDPLIRAMKDGQWPLVDVEIV